MISRTVRITKCYGQRVSRAGEFEDYYTELPDFIGLEKATRKVRRSEKDPTITLNKIEHYQAYYRMPLCTFMQNAEFLKEVKVDEND